MCIRDSLWLALCLCALAWPAWAEPLRLDERAAVAAWPAVTVLADPDGVYTVEQLVGQPQRFEPPTGTTGNLGRRDGAVWLRLPVVVPGTQEVRRVLEIDYPSLNQVDLYVVRDGEVRSHHRMGNSLTLAERALPTRTQAAPLTLQPGGHDLFLRVQTLSSVVLPITVRTPKAFTHYESQVQLVQGVTLGPVSYTHLDVYKRQVHARCGTGAPVAAQGRRVSSEPPARWFR